MLTKNDLQAIKGLIKGEVDPLRKDVGGIKENIMSLQKDMKTVKKDIRNIRNDINGVIGPFDKRLTKVENRLGIPPLKN